MTLDPGVIARDRRQGFFAQSFTAFSAKLISQNRLQAGAAQLKKHAALLAKVEQKYGVQGPVIVAFWALESDFGAGMGNLSVLRSLATLAYDCRRSEMFRDELMDAMRIVDRGDLRPEEMIGSWAGELGQTQFLPSHYLKHAVDFDGDGRRNLMSSAARCRRLDRQFPGLSRLATQPAVAAGSQAHAQSALGPGRPCHPTPALEVGGVGRQSARWTTVAGR